MPRAVEVPEVPSDFLHVGVRQRTVGAHLQERVNHAATQYLKYLPLL